MTTLPNRRHFLRQGLVLAAGAVCLPDWGKAFTATPTPAPLAPIEAWIQSFGANAVLTEATTRALRDGRTPAVLQFEVEIRDVAAFGRACSSRTAFGLKGVSAVGNVVSFRTEQGAFEAIAKLAA